jgi:hypothetical protein
MKVEYFAHLRQTITQNLHLLSAWLGKEWHHEVGRLSENQEKVRLAVVKIISCLK